MSVNSRLKATKIIGQRKEFYRQRIPEFSCARKETVEATKIIGQRKAFYRQRTQGSSFARKGTVDIDIHVFYSLFVS